MKNKAHLLLVALIIIFSVTVIYAFFKFFVFHSYQVLAETTCDPESEACFMYVCNPDVDDWCTGNPDDDTWYYKIIRKNGANVPICDPTKEEECEELSCTEGEAGCEEILCSEETIDRAAEGAYCSNPEDFMTDDSEMDGEDAGDEAMEEDAAASEGEDGTVMEEPTNEADTAVEGSEEPASSDATMPESAQNQDSSQNAVPTSQPQ